MADSEIDSFLTKFKYLCCTGVNASLNVTCSSGKATVMLHAEVGFISPPTPQVLQTPVKQRSPAYGRRLARRQAKRQNEKHLEEASSPIVKKDIVDEADTPSTVDNTVSEVSDFKQSAKQAPAKV